MKNEQHEYDVYTSTTRDTQIYCGSMAVEDIVCSEEWHDMEVDIPLHTVYAESEAAAVQIVAIEECVDPESLYAIQRTISVDDCMSAAGYCTDTAAGIRIDVNSGGINKTLTVELDKTTGRISGYSQPDGDNPFMEKIYACVVRDSNPDFGQHVDLFLTKAEAMTCLIGQITETFHKSPEELKKDPEYDVLDGLNDGGSFIICRAGCEDDSLHLWINELAAPHRSTDTRHDTFPSWLNPGSRVRMRVGNTFQNAEIETVTLCKNGVLAVTVMVDAYELTVRTTRENLASSIGPLTIAET